MKLILASQSPRRKQLLEWAEVPFDVVVANTDEVFPEGLSFEDAACYIALEKAKAVQKNFPNRDIVAADTIVVCNNEILGKPKDKQDAIQMLTKLAGNNHLVITGVALLKNGKYEVFADTTEVVFNPLSVEQIEFYVNKYKPFDKAGAYAIQEWIGVVGIQSIKGDFYNVMGLPVNRLVKLL